jgi:dTMP kinase
MKQSNRDKLNMKRGLFITVEGIEGAGKSTAVSFIANYLRNCNISYVLTREFGGTEIAEKIRNVLLSHHDEVMYIDTELLLAFAARAQHLHALIKPKLAANVWVLCDRFTDSSYAYQGGGRGISSERIAVIENWVQGTLRPDFTILLDVEPTSAFKRIKNKLLDRIEIEKINFFEKVRACYLQRAKDEPNRFRVVDANKNRAEVEAQVEKIMQEIINK